MANDFTSIPLYVDTVMASPAPFGRVFVKTISWSKQVAAGDALNIVDRNGKEIVNSLASGADQYQYWPVNSYIDSFQVTVLGSGVVIIYIK